MNSIFTIAQADLKTIANILILTSIIISLSAVAVCYAVSGYKITAKIFLCFALILSAGQIILSWNFTEPYIKAESKGAYEKLIELVEKLPANWESLEIAGIISGEENVE